MPVLDMRPEVTPNDDDMGQEVKDPTEEVVDEGIQDASSASEQDPSDDDQSIEEDTSEKTVAEPEGADGSDNKDSDIDRILEAKRQEAERLQDQIDELRQQRRDLRNPNSVQPATSPIIVDAPAVDLSDINPADVEIIEKVLLAKGYVRKDDLSNMSYQEKSDTYRDQWLAAHPEYLPENDPDDVLWGQFTKVLGSYFKQPANPADVTKILDAAHAMMRSSGQLPIKSRATTNAAKATIDAASKGSGGGSPKATQAKPSSGNANLRTDMLVGFSDDEKKELFS